MVSVIVKVYSQYIYDIAAIKPTYRFYRNIWGGDESKYLIGVQERRKYRLIYAIDLSVVLYEY